MRLDWTREELQEMKHRKQKVSSECEERKKQCAIDLLDAENDLKAAARMEIKTLQKLYLYSY